ncbi:uricase [Frankliniella occidentalis]|uniref:Uricase n=1 Tax=Frankliniella occidentalis TaxID=133901 RepID=A0A9C6X6A6_FRAOC|nr:uricase [Frankliniella occidentalis]
MNPQSRDEARGAGDVQPSYSSAVETPFLPEDLRTPAGSSAPGKDANEAYELAEYGYGKNYVKILKVRRDGLRHSIREYEVNTHLQLDSREDFLQGDNKHIIATDTQKNTVYVLAKKFGIKSPEAFSLLLCSHFLYTYPQVTEASVHIEEYPWTRIMRDGQKHNHAFVMSPVAYRSCTVSQRRNEAPRIRGELHGLRVLKTTQSSFRDFVQDEYRTLPDANDRIFSTVVTASWLYNTGSVDFDRVWHTVKECILDKFAGDPKEGIFSPSVQNTLYLAAKMVLDQVDEIERVEMQMPNKHYNSLDLSKFQSTIKGGFEHHEVYQPTDKPAGIIHAQLERSNKEMASRPRQVFRRRAKL